MELLDRQRRPPQLVGFHWFNGEPVSLQEHRGSIILLEFWDYANHKSLHSLQYVIEWNRRYRDFGLVVVGVHSPRYEFGHEIGEVEKSLTKHSIDFSVVMDNDRSIAHSYGIRELPTLSLVDRDGFLRYSHSGGGGYEQFERAIQALLAETGYHGAMPHFLEPISELDPEGAICYRPSSELEMGFLHGSLGNLNGYNPSSTVEYHDPKYYLPNRFYLEGKWIQEKEYVRFDGDPGEKGFLSLRYEGSGVNAIMRGLKDESRKLTIHRDSEAIPPSLAGDDVTFTELDESLVVINRAGLYELVRKDEFGEHMLRLSVNCPGVEIYSFSFLTSLIPDFVQRN